jgi:hypothetical protein
MSCLTFSGDNIIKAIVTGKLFLNKGTNDVLIPMRENESGECILAPTYLVNVINIKLS